METYTFLIWLSRLSSMIVIAVFILGSELLWGNANLSAQVPTFGITYHTELRFDKNKNAFQQEEILKDLTSIKQLNVDLVRTDVSWLRVPLNKNSALQFDSWFVDQVHLKGMKLMFVLKTPEQIALYSSLLKDVDYLQITNEPNSAAFSIALGSIDSKEIIQKLVSNLNLVQSYSSNSITVLNPVDMPKIPGSIIISWTDLYKNLAEKEISLPIIGFDSYPGGPYQWGYPLEIKRSVAITRQAIAHSEFSGHPIWIIETGSTTYRRTLASQSSYIKDAVKAIALSRANGLIIYEAFDNSKVTSEVTNYMTSSSLIEANFGIFYEDRTPKPAALVYKGLIQDFHNGLLVTETSLSQIIYVIFSALFRLIMPSGGPMVLSELVVFPNFLFIVLGFTFRYILGTGISKLSLFPLTDVALAIIILLVFSFFQFSSNNQVLLWPLVLQYSFLFFLFLWCGTSQITFLADTQIYRPMNFFYPLLPALLGISVVTLVGIPASMWFLIAFIETLLLVIFKVII